MPGASDLMAAGMPAELARLLAESGVAGWDQFRLSDYMDGNGVDDPTGLTDATTAWNANAVLPPATNPAADMEAFFVPSGKFTADDGVITGTGVGQAIFGLGRTSQLNSIGINFQSRHWTVSGLTLDGPADYGIKFTAPAFLTQVSGLYITERTTGIWGGVQTSSGQHSTQNLVVNTISRLNTWGRYFDDVNGNFANCVTIGSTYNGDHIEQAGQLKEVNCNTTASGRYNRYWTGRNNASSLESYMTQGTFTGTSGVRSIPMLSVANNGGLARITVAATKVVSAVANAGNRLVGNFENRTIQARGYLTFNSCTNGDALSSLRVNSTELLAGTVTAASSSTSSWVTAVAASVNLGTGTHGYSAEGYGSRLHVIAPSGDATQNWRTLAYTASGTPTFSTLGYVTMTLGSATTLAAGDWIYVAGTTDYNEVSLLNYVSGDGLTIGMQLDYTSSQTGTMVPHYRLNKGIINWTAVGGVYTSGFKISDVGPDPVTYIDTDMTYVSNDTGTITNDNWDLYHDSRDNVSRVSDLFYTGGNSNFTLVAGAYNIMFNGTRLKEQIYIDPRANEALRPNMILRMGTLRGRDIEAYTPVLVGGAIRGWGEIGMGDDSGGKAPGSAFLTMQMPSTSQGRSGGVAAFLNYVKVYETQLAFGHEGYTTTADATGWHFQSVRILPIANVVNLLQLKGSATGNDLIINTSGSDTNRSIQLKSAGATGKVKLQCSSGTNQIQIDDTGIGFYGTGTQAKPTITGAKGGNAALASLLTALAAFGLITDNTTA